MVKLDQATTLNGQRIAIAVDGGTVKLNGTTTVTKTDIDASNGIIHVIDTVLMPVQTDVVAVASSAGTFKTLLAALDAASLTDVLKGSGPFTVLAPTDEAFKKLPAGTVESLLKPENKDRLVAILKLHVIPGRNFSDTLLADKHAPATLQGTSLKFKSKDGTVQITGGASPAHVAKADIQASNGVVHVIDSVLLPK